MHLAELLKAKLQRFVDGDKEGFKEQIKNEADRIAAVPFGVPMLEVIGCVKPLRHILQFRWSLAWHWSAYMPGFGTACICSL